MTLIEVLVGLVILTMSVMMVYSVASGAARAHAQLSTPEEIANSISGLHEVLRNYVSADPTSATAADFAPSGSWALPADACAYALAAGCAHIADGFLSQRLLNRYPGARLSYAIAAPLVSDGPWQVTYSVTLP